MERMNSLSSEMETESLAGRNTSITLESRVDTTELSSEIETGCAAKLKEYYLKMADGKTDAPVDNKALILDKFDFDLEGSSSEGNLQRVTSQSSLDVHGKYFSQMQLSTSRCAYLMKEPLPQFANDMSTGVNHLCDYKPIEQEYDLKLMDAMYDTDDGYISSDAESSCSEMSIQF